MADMDKPVSTYGTDFTFDEVGNHFFANIESYRLLAYSYVRDKQIAEDIVSDSFVRLWEHKDELDPGKGDYRRYIVQMIKNACLEHIRSLKIHTRIHQQIQDDEDWKLQISLRSLENGEIEDRLFSSDVEKIIMRELDKLPKLTREIFIDSRFRFLSHKEISEKHDLPIRRIKWEITKTLEVLKVALKDYIPVYLALAFFIGDTADIFPSSADTGEESDTVPHIECIHHLDAHHPTT